MVTRTVIFTSITATVVNPLTQEVSVKDFKLTGNLEHINFQTALSRLRDKFETPECAIVSVVRVHKPAETKFRMEQDKFISIAEEVKTIADTDEPESDREEPESDTENRKQTLDKPKQKK